MSDDENKKPGKTPFKIVDLHHTDKSKPKHVDMFKGKKIFMDIEPDDGGFNVLYYYECTQQTMVGEMTHRHVVAGYYMKRRWFHRLFRISNWALIEVAVRLAKMRWEEVKKNTNEFEAIRESHGLSNAELESE